MRRPGEDQVAAAAMEQFGPMRAMAAEDLAAGEADRIARQTTHKEMLEREALVQRFVGALPGADYRYDQGGFISGAEMHAATEVGVRAVQASVLWTYAWGSHPFYVVGQHRLRKETSDEELKRDAIKVLLFPAHDRSGKRAFAPAVMNLVEEDMDLRERLGARGFATPSGLPVDGESIRISCRAPGNTFISPYARRPKPGKATLETVAQNGVRSAMDWPHVTTLKPAFLTEDLWDAYNMTETLSIMAARFGHEEEALLRRLLRGDAAEPAKPETRPASDLVTDLGRVFRAGVLGVKKFLDTNSAQ